MSPDDDAFVRSLVAYDEALAAGRTVEQTPAVGAAADCLRLLARVFGAAPPPTTPTLTLGRFRLVRALGRGAFGVVHLAEDPLLRRQVALKVPHAAPLLTPELRQRFLREARLAASLDHPHIVRIHEAGEEGGVCYIAAEYCPGATLAQRLAEAPLPADEAARLVATLAGAVQHAHDKGVVHRDLKPANILLASGVASAPRVWRAGLRQRPEFALRSRRFLGALTQPRSPRSPTSASPRTSPPTPRCRRSPERSSARRRTWRRNRPRDAPPTSGPSAPSFTSASSVGRRSAGRRRF